MAQTDIGVPEPRAENPTFEQPENRA